MNPARLVTSEGGAVRFRAASSNEANATSPAWRRTRTMLGTTELAERWGVDASTARRWLVALERRYGARVVLRTGAGGRAKMVTSEAALQRVAIHANTPMQSASERERETSSDALRDLRRLVNALGARVRTLETAARDRRIDATPAKCGAPNPGTIGTAQNR